jgi:hypothetical protein
VKVEITRRARIDLIEIGDYLERVAGRRTALRWVVRLEAKALALAARRIPNWAGTGGWSCGLISSSIALYLAASFALPESCTARAISPPCLRKKRIEGARSALPQSVA